MKTNLIQSMLHRNATAITMLAKQLCESKADAKGAAYEASRRHHRAKAAKLSATVAKLSAIQRDLKVEMLAHKLARPHVRTKHGMDDPRYVAWQEGIGGAAPFQNAA